MCNRNLEKSENTSTCNFPKDLFVSSPPFLGSLSGMKKATGSIFMDGWLKWAFRSNEIFLSARLSDSLSGIFRNLSTFYAENDEISKVNFHEQLTRNYSAKATKPSLESSFPSSQNLSSDCILLKTKASASFSYFICFCFCNTTSKHPIRNSDIVGSFPPL